MFSKLISVIILSITLFISANASPEVAIPNGIIIGREDVTINNKTYYAFEKIPYAAPPVGELRFRAPIAPPNWEEPLETFHLDVGCYQVGTAVFTQSEDCLYLNVFTPELPQNDRNPLFPVMLFIHGGGFIAGAGLEFRSDFIIEEEIILVVINYRVGPFGFLSTQDTIIPGNNGLKDQQFAINWVYQNIKTFGGDPEKITLFGQSAGSASISYQLINQKSRGLFKGAILESGTALNPWAFQRNSRKIAFKTASFLNEDFNNNTDSQALLEFLLSVKAEDLNEAAIKFSQYEANPEDVEIFQGFYWGPVIEVKNPDAFLTRNMYGLLQAGNAVGVPIITGMTSEESIVSGDLETNMAAFDQHLGWLVPNDMQIQDESVHDVYGGKIRNIYTGGEPLAEHLGDGIRYSSDTSFTRSIIKHAELYSKYFKTYFYQFSYDGLLGGNDVHYENAGTVGHTEDIRYIFCFDTNCDLKDYPESDQITVRRLIKMWTNFAKYQNPTPETSDLLQGITWPLLNTDEGDFFYLDINGTLEIRNHPKNETYTKWVELYDSLDFNNFDTY